MAKFKLTPAQVATINAAVVALDAIGTQHSTESVFGEYGFYRRQDATERKVMAIGQFCETLEDIRTQLNEAATDQADDISDDQRRQYKLLESQIDAIITSVKMTARAHKARRLLSRVGSTLFGPGH